MKKTYFLCRYGMILPSFVRILVSHENPSEPASISCHISFFLKTAQVSASGLGPGGLDSSGVANSNPKPPGPKPPICTP